MDNVQIKEHRGNISFTYLASFPYILELSHNKRYLKSTLIKVLKTINLRMLFLGGGGGGAPLRGSTEQYLKAISLGMIFSCCCLPVWLQY